MSMNDDAAETLDPGGAIDREIRQYLARSHVPGLCVSVYSETHFPGRAGVVIPWGLATLTGVNEGPSVTEMTTFELASVTKLFTSLMLAYWVEKSVATLEDNLGHWLNQHGAWGQGEIGNSSLQEIQLVQLATHTSGMPDAVTGLNPAVQLFAGEAPDGGLISYWDTYKPPSPAGSCWEYSSLGYVTLGFATTQISTIGTPGANYGPSLAEIVTTPLQMSGTSANPGGALVATGYIGRWSKDESGQFTFEGNTQAKGVAADLKSNGVDMLSFLDAQLGITDLSAYPDLKAAIALTQQEVGAFNLCQTTPGGQPIRMGLGWQILDAPGGAGNLYWKNGATSVGGFQSYVMLIPQLAFGVSVLTNQYLNSKQPSPPGVKPGALAFAILEALFPEQAKFDPAILEIDAGEE